MKRHLGIAAVFLLLFSAEVVPKGIDLSLSADFASPTSASLPLDIADDASNPEEESDIDANEDGLIFTEQLFHASRTLSHFTTNDALPNDFLAQATPPPKFRLA